MTRLLFSNNKWSQLLFLSTWHLNLIIYYEKNIEVTKKKRNEHKTESGLVRKSQPTLSDTLMDNQQSERKVKLVWNKHIKMCIEMPLYHV